MTLDSTIERSSLREALLELTHRGMVEQVRNRGFRVVQHTSADLEAALELRELLEVPLLARLAGTLDREDAVRGGRGTRRS